MLYIAFVLPSHGREYKGYIYIIREQNFCVLVYITFVYSNIIFNLFCLDTSIEGYVHLLSDVQSASNSTSSYFDFKIQVSDSEAARAVCYSPKKRVNLQQAYINKSPIKITGVRKATKRYHSGGPDEFTISKEAKIAPCSLPFEYNDEMNNRLCTIEEALSKDVYEKVDIKGKVYQKDNVKEKVLIREMPKYKVDAYVADQTENIKIVLWEDAINKVNVGKTYHFKNLRVRIFDDAKFLNTNELTIIEQIEDMPDVNFNTPKMQDKILTGRIISALIKRSSSCIVCNASLKDINEEVEITCNKCGMTTLVSACDTKVVAQLVVKTEDAKILKFTTFNDGIQSVLDLNHSNDSLNEIDIANLRKKLFDSGLMKMIVDKANHVIAQFLPHDA